MRECDREISEYLKEKKQKDASSLESIQTSWYTEQMFLQDLERAHACSMIVSSTEDYSMPGNENGWYTIIFYLT